MNPASWAGGRHSAFSRRGGDKPQDLLTGSSKNHLVAYGLDVLHTDEDFCLPESMPKVVFISHFFVELNPDGQDVPPLLVELDVVDRAQLVPLGTDYLFSDDFGA
jgi:hypothetical protein